MRPDLATRETTRAWVSLANTPPDSAIHATDLLQLRTAINRARTALGAMSYVFSDDLGPGLPIRARHFRDLREALR